MVYPTLEYIERSCYKWFFQNGEWYGMWLYLNKAVKDVKNILKILKLKEVFIFFSKVE